MNNRQNGRRRGRGGQQARNGQPGQPDRGNRIDNRARGNAAQLLEKYKSLARDAQMAGDRVNTEYYLQFADHYFRVLSESRSRFEDGRPDQGRRRDEYRDEFGRDGEDGFDGDELAADEAGEEAAPAVPPRGGGKGWREPERAEAPAPEPQRPARDAVELPPRAVVADEGERYAERRPRRGRNGRGAGGGGAEATPAEAAPAAAERIEVDRLPAGFGTAAPAPVAEAAPVEPAAAPAPRRRAPRKPRPEAIAEA